MDQFIFKLLRSAAIIFYLIGLAMGGLMLFGLAAITLQMGSGALVEESSLLLAIAWAVMPLAIGFALDRLANIGTGGNAKPPA